MLHLPKKRPWLILIAIYALIIGVWATVFILARGSSAQSLDAEEAEKVLEQRKAPALEKNAQ
jgi:type VI protein secretion system component VasK